jgi:hypothetical protein
MVAKFPNDPRTAPGQQLGQAAISEGSGDPSGYTSYTVDKGVKMVMCVTG